MNWNQYETEDERKEIWRSTIYTPLIVTAEADATVDKNAMAFQSREHLSINRQIFLAKSVAIYIYERRRHQLRDTNHR